MNRVILGYWKEAELYYRKSDGTPANTIGNVHIALSCLRVLYGNTPAAQFGPKPADHAPVGDVSLACLFLRLRQHGPQPVRVPTVQLVELLITIRTRAGSAVEKAEHFDELTADRELGVHLASAFNICLVHHDLFWLDLGLQSARQRTWRS